MAKANQKPSPIVTKLFLMLVNFLFLIMGIIIVALGFYFWTNAKVINFSEIFAGLEALRYVKFLLIACGSLFVLVGLCGFLGAYKENRCLIILYAILCTLILIGNLTSVIMAFVYNKQVKSYVSEQIKDHMARFYGGNNTAEPGSDAFTKGVDDMQKMEQCCGWTGLGGVNLYKSTPWFANHNKQRLMNYDSYPESCCTESALKDGKQLCVLATNETFARKEGYVHKDDCFEKLMTVNSRIVRIVIGSLLVATLLQIICIICSIMMADHLAAQFG